MYNFTGGRACFDDPITNLGFHSNFHSYDLLRINFLEIKNFKNIQSPFSSSHLYEVSHKLCTKSRAVVPSVSTQDHSSPLRLKLCLYICVALLLNFWECFNKNTFLKQFSLTESGGGKGLPFRFLGSITNVFEE